MAKLDLSPWRVGLNGAEPIDPRSVEEFVAASARHGLDPRSVYCAFGMAEATLAVTFPQPFSGMTTDTVDRRVVETERFAAQVSAGHPNARSFARLGKPVLGIEVRIVDPASGMVANDREVGELQVSGASLMTGYYKRARHHQGDLRRRMAENG